MSASGWSRGRRCAAGGGASSCSPLLVGFVGAVVLASVAGARRTATSLDRFEDRRPIGRRRDQRGSDDRRSSCTSSERSPGVAKRWRVLRAARAVPGRRRLVPPDRGPGRRRLRALGRSRPARRRPRRARRADELTIGESLAERARDLASAIVCGFELVQPGADRARTDLSDDAGATRSACHVPVVGHRAPAARPRRRGAAGGVVVPTPGVRREHATRSGASPGTCCACAPSTVQPTSPASSRAARRIFGDAEHSRR